MSEIEAITRLDRDFSEQNAPFDGATLPEAQAIEYIVPEDALPFLSYGVSLDYNRSADQLWDNCLDLYEQDRQFFNPEAVVEMDAEELRDTFTNIGFRYGNKDADGWMKNSRILVEHFDGTWWNLLERADFDAPRLMDVLDEYGFHFLKGEKLAPFYCKVVDANVFDLERVWELPVPVDTWIRKITQELVGKDMTDDEIRDFWKEYGNTHDINPMSVDTSMWLIGNNLNDWGADYLMGVMDTETFKYL